MKDAEVDFNKIAQKWQRKWDKEKVFHAEADSSKKKYYVAIVYPYMSGLLHLGHLFTYTFSEIVLRYKRMQGFNVLAKYGYHCTGTPIVAAAQRVKEKEPTQIETLKKMGIGGREIHKFANPEYWCEYFPKETLKDAKSMGFSIDERYAFKTTYLNPSYDAFVRWQFNRLKEKGYVKKGKHPVMWCPKDNLPVGDHDRSEGEGETPQEYLLFKHKLDDGKYILSATLRHDTVLGITNLFVNPDSEYCEASVDGEQWIIGQNAAERLKYHGYNTVVKKKILGSELIGKKTTEFDGSAVLILPAYFLDPNVGTGLVHSVPSDSPDDLIALKELQNDEATCKKFGLNISEVRKIKPIPVLNTPDYGNVAAEAMLKKHSITSQKQRGKLEEAKKELYRISHYTATFNELYKSKFSTNLEGKKVDEGKDTIKKDLIKEGFALRYYEPTGKVVCRCLTECIIKVVDDQWFVEYNDPEWKKAAHGCLGSMNIYPEIVRKQFHYVIDWLDHWACTREYGLGTKLPWDDKWVIESLSDSTLQMAYGTISKYLLHPEDYGFKIDKLNDEFFDYVYSGKGNISAVEKATGIPKKMIETMRRDFEYWYPFDFRNSAKDLVQNHLAFCIFNHVALFPKKHWPKAFVINGRIMINNEKMSKSKGNFFTMRELYTKHGPDIVRLAAAYAGEGVDDANYDMEFLETAKRKLRELYEFIKSNYNKGRTEMTAIDRWFESKINTAIKNTTEALESMLFKSAVQYSLMDMTRHLKTYLKRTNDKPNKRLINLFSESLIKMLTPVTPHFCEEAWEAIGGKGFISTQSWPDYEEEKIDKEAEAIEQLIHDMLSDFETVLKLAQIEKPKEVTIVAAPDWKYELVKILKEELKKTRDQRVLINTCLSEKDIKPHGQEVAKIVQAVLNDPGKLPQMIIRKEKEIEAYAAAKETIENEHGAKVKVEEAERSKEQKARQAMPSKPAIIVR